METADTRRPILPPATEIAADLRRFAGNATGAAARARLAYIGVLALSAVLFIWGLDRNGYANTYYSAAVVAGTHSWKAFFFGAFDAGSFITIDKPPAALWLMELSTRIFGVSSWSILLPEALLGVATVGLVMSAVRRSFGPVAAILAGIVTALTPVAVLMFRFNNPDALLTFLMVVAAWAMIRSLETGRTRWLLVSAAAVGLAFNTKYLQAYIVLPALVLTYLLFGRPRLGQRVLQLLAAGGVLAASTGWWMSIVDAIPAASRPYIGGSAGNSVLDLVLGYDGLGRIFGQGRSAGTGFGALLEAITGAGAGTTGGPGGDGFAGQPGLLRLFNSEIAGEISWLLPASALALLLGLWVTRSRVRTDMARAGYVLWGAWLLTHFAVFSFASGIFHSYYTIAMAPAVGALVGGGVVEIWRLRGYSQFAAGMIAAAALISTAWWANQLLARTPGFAPGLGSLELGLALAVSVLLLLPRAVRVPAQLARVGLAVGAGAMLLGPAAYAVATVNKTIAGAIPSSGPVSAVTAMGLQPGGQGFARRAGGFTGQAPLNAFRGQMPPGAIGGGPPVGANLAAGPATADGSLVSYLLRNQGRATWLVAVSSAGQGASIEIATGRAVLAMGGFNGSDPAMTVSRLKQLVSSGQLRYVLAGGRGGLDGGQGGGPPGVRDAANSVSSWVTSNCTSVDYTGSGSMSGGLYDCAAAAAGSAS